MRLQIENFARIKRAELQFDGITVVAGKNNTGKSTVGKVLFALFHSYFRIGELIVNRRWNNIAQVSENILARYRQKNYEVATILGSLRSEAGLSKFLKRNETFDLNKIIDDVKKYAKETYSIEVADDEVLFQELKSGIAEIINIPDETLEKAWVSLVFRSTFAGQANSFFNNQQALLSLNIRNFENVTRLADNKCVSCQKGSNILFDAFYVDDPFLLDMWGRGRFISSLPRRILLEYIETASSNNEDIISTALGQQKLKKVFNMLKTVIPGDFIKRNDRLMLKQEGLSDDILITNLSTGIKSFAMLKCLIEAGNLKKQSILILDEPEVHLHPKWQLLYAELIVLLQKEFQLTILLTTHSPYFLNAIEVYTSKYEVADRFHCYLSDTDRKGMVTFSDVTERTDSVYQELSEPMEELETMRLALRMDE